MARHGPPKERSRWLGESRDAGGQFLKGEHRRRIRIGLIVVIVAIGVIVITGWIALQPDEPKIELIDVMIDDDAAPPALASVQARQATTSPAPPPQSSTTTTLPTTTSTTTTTTTSTSVSTPTTASEEPAAPPTELTPIVSDDATINPLRAPTSDTPLRIYIGGDSLSGTPGFALQNLAKRSDLFNVVVDTRTSSGLVASWFFDWPTYVENHIAPQGFDVVVFSMGANDAQRFISTDIVGSEEWLAKYRDRMEATLLAAQAPGRLVVWIGMPPVTPPNIEPVMALLNTVAESLADELDNVVFIDAWSMFEGEDGGFTTHLEGPGGDLILIRAGDGVHYADIAGYWLAEAVLDAAAAKVNTSSAI